jgi:hypothetical protein
VLSAAALWLHLRAAAASAASDHPGLVPGEYLHSLTGKDLYSPDEDPAVLAAELCTAGLWERADGSYRILDLPTVQEFTGKVRELRDKDNRAGQAAITEMTRFGERIGRTAAASFRCAACGEMAAVVKVARAGITVDMGPPLGCETYHRDALVVDYFLGTASRFADAATLDTVQEIVSSSAPDPEALRRIDQELAPFYCPDCGLNYCHADWETFPVFDEGFYDCTIGICPRGHRHTVDD